MLGLRSDAFSAPASRPLPAPHWREEGALPANQRSVGPSSRASFKGPLETNERLKAEPGHSGAEEETGRGSDWFLEDAALHLTEGCTNELSEGAGSARGGG